MLWIILPLIILVGFGIAGFTGAPWLPTRRRDVAQLLDDTNLRKGQIFLELGCGDGRLVAAAAKRGAIATGYEINPLLWFIAVLRTVRYYPRAKIHLGSFWPVDLAKADVVMIFLIQRFMKRFENKAQKQMKHGATLVSYVYRLPTKAPRSTGLSWFIYRY
ncbi:MAG TPA: hypothetical protein VLF90_01495 [Patescibacteria group bacterium]|nr:hypothetical protein [Patescibacteria group bacterium]